MNAKEIQGTETLVSVIIPVYNAEKYLRKCLNSIMASDFKDFEVICINDGSTDSSAQILTEFENRYHNIIVTEQENSGVSSARNAGIKIASGKWLTFIDSDDLVTETYLYSLTAPLNDNPDLDFIHAGYTNYIDNRASTVGQGYTPYIGRDKDYLYPRFRGLVFSKLFKKSIIEANSIRFADKIQSAEDMLFTLDYVNHIDQFAFVEGTGYLYRKDNSGSLTHTLTPKPYDISLRQFLHEYRSVTSFVNKHRLTEKAYRMRYQRLCDELLFTIYRLYDTPLQQKERILRLTHDISHATSSLRKYCNGKLNRIVLQLLDHRMFIIADAMIYFFTKSYGRHFRKQ